MIKKCIVYFFILFLFVFTNYWSYLMGRHYLSINPMTLCSSKTGVSAVFFEDKTSYIAVCNDGTTFRVTKQ